MTRQGRRATDARPVGAAAPGYEAPADSARHRDQLLLPREERSDDLLIILPEPCALPLASLSAKEGSAFAFFQQHTAGELQGCFQSELWNKWAMQLSHQEPTVRSLITCVLFLRYAYIRPDLTCGHCSSVLFTRLDLLNP